MKSRLTPIWLACLAISSAPKLGRAGVNPSNTIAKDQSTDNSAEPAPATVISSSNAKQYSPLIPAAAAFALDHGMSIKVGVSEPLDWSTGFKQATEKYSPQVGLDQHDHILNYVAGMPFPLVEFNDPKAAVKIAYNWHMGPFMPDDFSLRPWGSYLYAFEANNSTSIRKPAGLQFRLQPVRVSGLRPSDGS